jgi:hypothetical protein
MRCEPETANKRGASAPAPGSERKMKKSGCALATSSILQSRFANPSLRWDKAARESDPELVRGCEPGDGAGPFFFGHWQSMAWSLHMVTNFCDAAAR